MPPPDKILMNFPVNFILSVIDASAINGMYWLLYSSNGWNFLPNRIASFLANVGAVVSPNLLLYDWNPVHDRYFVAKVNLVFDNSIRVVLQIAGVHSRFMLNILVC